MRRRRIERTYLDITNEESPEILINLSSRLYFFVITVITFILILSMFNLQVVNGVLYADRSKNNITSTKYFAPSRGLIFDSNGYALAQNEIYYDLYLNKKHYSNDDIANLTKILDEGFPSKDLLVDLNGINDQNSDIKILDYLTEDEANMFEEVLESDNSFYLAKGEKRVYKYPLEFSHLLGYTGKVNEEDLKKEGYETTDHIGKYKLEAYLEDGLKGIKHKSVFVGETEIKQDGEAGQNYTLTIDNRWQRALYNSLQDYNHRLGGAGGAGVIIDTENGKVKALVSFPGFDANQFVTGAASSYLDELANSRNKPLVDKSIGAQAAPGSIFKLITSYTLLQSGIVDRNTRYFSNRCIKLGSSDFCEFGRFFYGDMNIERAITKSSNLFFCEHMIRYENEFGIAGFVNSAKQFGIGYKTGIDLPGEISGNMDSPEYKKTVFNLGWFTGDTCNAAIGQGSIVVTPIQMAQVVATIQNGGKFLKPQLIEKTTDSKGRVISSFEPEVLRTIEMSEETRNLILSGMYSAAHNPEGTVYVFLNNVPGNIYVKTGSAETVETIDGIQHPRVEGWAIGLFEYENKTYAYSIFLNYSGGGYYVAPVIEKFARCLYSDFAGCN